MTEDVELLAGWSAGDRAMGEQLFERHFDAMYRFFRTKVDEADVGDLVQKTFLACVESAGSFKGLSSVRAYFFGVARHQLFRHYRARRRAGGIDFGVSSVADLAPSPSSLVARAEEHRLLNEALWRIPLDLQVALELRFVEGLRGPELARVLEIPEGTVRSRLRRGVEALRAQIERLPSVAEQRRDALRGVQVWEREVQAVS